MPEQLKFALKSIAIFIIVIFVLLVTYICVVFHNLGIASTHYRQYCPSRLVNTKWVCQEKNIYFITYEEGEKSTGKVEIDGIKKTFDIYFPLRPDGFLIVSGQTESGAMVSEFVGSAEYDDGVCRLIYDAEDDMNSFFGKESGKVTLTFIKDYIPNVG